MHGKGHRTFTLETALDKVRRIRGVKLDQGARMIFCNKDAVVGNSSWGILDYLCLRHHYRVFRCIDKGTEEWVLV